MTAWFVQQAQLLGRATMPATALSTHDGRVGQGLGRVDDERHDATDGAGEVVATKLIEHDFEAPTERHEDLFQHPQVEALLGGDVVLE